MHKALFIFLACCSFACSRGMEATSSKTGTPQVTLAALFRQEKIGDGDIDYNEPESNGDTLLHRVVRTGSTSGIIVFLWKHGADLHAKNNDGQTPLELAAALGNKEAYDFLSSIAGKKSS